MENGGEMVGRRFEGSKHLRGEFLCFRLYILSTSAAGNKNFLDCLHYIQHG